MVNSTPRAKVAVVNEKYLTTREFAARAGLSHATIRSYRRAPEADYRRIPDPDYTDPLSGFPGWLPATVDDWIARRADWPGSGYRTDVRHPE